MLDQFLGHRPRVTAYFAVLAVGLALVSSGVEAGRLRLVGELEPSVFTGYVAVALLVALVLAFTAAYLNESLVAGWLVGAVPAASHYGGTYLRGGGVDPAVAALGTVGTGLVVGGLGYALAAEKHRLEAGSGDMAGVTPRATFGSLAAASIAVGVACLLAVPIV